MSGRPRFPRDWPRGQRVAVTVGVPFEAFINGSRFSYIGAPGKPDDFSPVCGDDAWKAGIWRLLDPTDDFGVEASMSTGDLAAERRYRTVRICANERHEVNSHRGASDVRAKDALEEVEREGIRRCAEVLEQVADGTLPFERMR